MRKLALIVLAASAAVLPAASGAQPAPPAGHSWSSPGGHRTVVRNRDGRQRIVVRQRGNGNQRIVVRQRDGGQRVVVRDGGQRIVVRQRDGRRFHGRRFPHITRIVRGHRVPHFWFGPQFHIQNWQMYGFAQPMHDWRWIRYYDDALLIDRAGTVHDARYGFDWGRYEDQWGYDERGVPVYRGGGDHHRSDEDYALDEEEAEGWDTSEYAERGDYREERRYGHGGPGYPPPPMMPPMMPPPGAHAYGYGYGAATITETITETFVEAPTTGYVEEVVEEVVETRRPRRVRRAPRPRCHCPPPRRARPAPPPPSGERG